MEERKGNPERPSFREFRGAVFAPVTYARELASRGVQRRDVPTLVAVGLLELVLAGNVAMGFEANGPVGSALYFLATNVALGVAAASLIVGRQANDGS